MSKGSRNLILLGLGSVMIALTTTCVSLAIYNTTGDIFLDRSRPGFLPDEDEAEEEATTSTDFQFPESGAITSGDLEEYLKELETVKKKLDNLDPYNKNPLSDESLGIPSSVIE